MKTSVACLVLACLAFASATPWEECGSTTGDVDRVRISGCDDGKDPDVFPCLLERGNSKNVTIVFTSKTTSENVTAVVYWIIGGVPMETHLPKPDGCAFGGLSCPLENGKSYTYFHSIDIKSYYPPLDVKLRWELKDDSKNHIVCVRIKCKFQ